MTLKITVVVERVLTVAVNSQAAHGDAGTIFHGFSGSGVFPLLLALAFRAVAHDIPNDVTAQVFVKPHNDRLNVMVRVPLKAIRDINFPERGPGYLDLDRTDPLLSDAA